MISRFDHLVLTVRSIPDAVAFCERALGIGAETRDGRTALHVAGHTINLHETGHEFEPKAKRPMPGSGDVCLCCDEPIGAVQARLEARGIAVEVGPVDRAGARAGLRSISIRDPDGNLVETANEVQPVRPNDSA